MPNFFMDVKQYSFGAKNGLFVGKDADNAVVIFTYSFLNKIHKKYY